ncbi:MAG TPA: RNA polymerase subunit sigma [Desulfobacteraceae bacterium]|nr:RNA polymerase subunit sigma [Deltaproteobacteria bacterium]RLB97982.1 MAG: RNA polymerase subunit sigma [Deltaproteobacteria bacterium]HDI60660.1 RNA polymerase subunit sigma [Desulfobacteraceae bacterium]
MDAELCRLIESFAGSGGNLLVVTGEGVSEECGVASFRADPRPFIYRGKSYEARELMTWALFDQAPDVVWAWHLLRLAEARRGQPGLVHQAAARAAETLGPRLKVITECVDGLHRRCQHPAAGLFEPQGNLFFMHCAAGCTPALHPVPEALQGRTAQQPLTADELALLRCPACGGLTRPHILWRDESYDEPLHSVNSILETARRSELLVMAGFSGHTNLANKVAWEITHNHRARIVDINPEPNPVAALARRTGGLAFNTPPSVLLPQVLETFVAAAG